MSQAEFEKLGVFYLGRGYDLAQKRLKPDLCLYDSRDLVTHGICIGMTGSGKTGLCLGLLEEAAIDGIPVIAIDPKGDLGNLMLTFPDLRPQDFAPWIDPDQARRGGITVEELAQQESLRWQKGLADWQQDGERIKRLKEAADIAIYTPGSNAGIPISIVKSFDTPPDAVLDDSDSFAERINSTASSLLALLGISGDPLRSKEHILLSTILSNAWQARQNLTLPALIQLIQKPPITQIGALDLESFFPAKERFQLAMSLNNLLASPGFASWMQGQALDIDKLLFTEAGKPRIAVFSIAHLDDSQRMFFVSLLLNQMVSWMRAQSGTSSLRTILYMDEIFGYFPPVANPPSKTPLLTLLKQGRAFGVGVLLATQNPVDLDYKGLSNTGTWFIGKLQTEQDKLRVLDGLEGAAANSGSGFDRQSMDKTMSALGNRVFLMNNVHEAQPEIFQTRWSLSYLRGPLTREQIKILMNPYKTFQKSLESGRPAADSTDNLSNPAPHTVNKQAATPPGPTGALEKPILAPDVPEFFLPIRTAPAAADTVVYKPALIAIGNVRFTDTKSSLDTTLQYSVLAAAESDGATGINWDSAPAAKVWKEDLQSSPQPGAAFEALPAGFGQAKSYAAWTKEFSNWLFANKKVKLFKSEMTGQYSKPRESERDFRVRLSQSARESRDLASADLKTKYAPKLAALQERLRRAQQALEKQQLEARDQQVQSAISVGSTVLGALMGRRTLSTTTINRAGTAARRVGRTMRDQQDVAQANDTVDAICAQLEQLNAAFTRDAQALEGKFDPLQTPLAEITVAPKKSNVSVPLLALGWAPYLRKPGSPDQPCWPKPSPSRSD